MKVIKLSMGVLAISALAMGCGGDDGATGPAGQRGAAGTDGTNGTNFGAESFNNIIDGACQLETALQEAGVEELNMGTIPPLQTIVDRIDMDLQKILAYSAGHEAFGVREITTAGLAQTDSADTDKRWSSSPN